LINVIQLSVSLFKWLNVLVIIASVTLCSLLLLLRLPGMEILEITPNWLLIWVVAWSVKRTVWQGLIAGIALGLIYDGMTSADPSHVLSLVLVGVLTASLRKEEYLREDFISVALIVFFMSIIATTAIALQHSLQHFRSLTEIWQDYQRIGIISALINSLWTPAIYYPLSRWWDRLREWEKS
jgi:rod shape-determining protein MreD